MGAVDDERVILEFYRVGPWVKVSAFDPMTMTEVSIIGPAGASKAELERTVLQKLAYILGKNR